MGLSCSTLDKHPTNNSSPQVPTSAPQGNSTQENKTSNPTKASGAEKKLDANQQLVNKFAAQAKERVKKQLNHIKQEIQKEHRSLMKKQENNKKTTLEDMNKLAKIMSQDKIEKEEFEKYKNDTRLVCSQLVKAVEKTLELSDLKSIENTLKDTFINKTKDSLLITEKSEIDQENSLRKNINILKLKANSKENSNKLIAKSYSLFIETINENLNTINQTLNVCS